LRSHSLAVLGDAAHSSVDALNNVVALAALHVAAAPPDEEHPYGHAKFETLGALVVTSFLSITAYELVMDAASRLLHGGDRPVLGPLTFALLGATMVVNLAVAAAENRAASRLGSEILAADAKHTAADVWVTVSVIGGLGLVALGWEDADAWLALAVAVLIARAAYQILRGAVPHLVDHRAVEADRIRTFVRGIPGIEGVTEIRSRGRLESEAFAELTVTVDGTLTVEEGHEIADRVERRLREEGGFVGVVVHVEPAAVHEGGQAPDAS
jgi:cation diffusion facilitator family transporter